VPGIKITSPIGNNIGKVISNKEPFPVLLFLLFFLSAFTRGVLSSPQGKSWHRPAASVLPGNDLFYFFVATWRGGNSPPGKT
jgi:hypothetical protein